MATVNAVDGSEPQIPETGSLSGYIAAVRAGLADGTLVNVETGRERLERLQLAAGSFARHVVSALILYVAPATVICVAARGLLRRRAPRQ